MKHLLVCLSLLLATSAIVGCAGTPDDDPAAIEKIHQYHARPLPDRIVDAAGKVIPDARWLGVARAGGSDLLYVQNSPVLGNPFGHLEPGRQLAELDLIRRRRIAPVVDAFDENAEGASQTVNLLTEFASEIDGLISGSERRRWFAEADGYLGRWRDLHHVDTALTKAASLWVRFKPTYKVSRVFMHSVRVRCLDLIDPDIILPPLSPDSRIYYEPEIVVPSHDQELGGYGYYLTGLVPGLRYELTPLPSTQDQQESGYVIEGNPVIVTASDSSTPLVEFPVHFTGWKKVPERSGSARILGQNGEPMAGVKLKLFRDFPKAQDHLVMEVLTDQNGEASFRTTLRGKHRVDVPALPDPASGKELYPPQNFTMPEGETRSVTLYHFVNVQLELEQPFIDRFAVKAFFDGRVSGRTPVDPDHMADLNSSQGVEFALVAGTAKLSPERENSVPFLSGHSYEIRFQSFSASNPAPIPSYVNTMDWTGTFVTKGEENQSFVIKLKQSDISYRSNATVFRGPHDRSGSGNISELVFHNLGYGAAHLPNDLCSRYYAGVGNAAGDNPWVYIWRNESDTLNPKVPVALEGRYLRVSSAAEGGVNFELQDFTQLSVGTFHAMARKPGEFQPLRAFIELSTESFEYRTEVVVVDKYTVWSIRCAPLSWTNAATTLRIPGYKLRSADDPQGVSSIDLPSLAAWRAEILASCPGEAPSKE